MGAGLGFVIALTCLSWTHGMQPSYNEGCNKALEAVSVQSGVRQGLDGISSYTAREARRKVGEKVRSVGILMLGGYRVYRDREATLNLSAKPLASSIGLKVYQTGASATLTWSF